MTTESIGEYALDDAVGRHLSAFLLIKGFDQEAVVERIIQRKGERAFGLTAASDAADRKYSKGHIIATDLNRERFDATILSENDCDISCFEPFSIDFRNQMAIYTNGSDLRQVDLRNGARDSVTHDWLSFAHTVEFSPDGGAVLTSSAGFDTALELDLASGAARWEWNAWDHSINRAVLNGTYVTRNARQADLFRRKGRDVLFVSDPRDWPPEGIPTPRSPARLNGAAYDRQGRILLTFYHRPEIVVIERGESESCVKLDLDLSHPHGFVPARLSLHEGYMVTNSGRGELLLLDRDFAIVRRFSFARLPADPSKKRAFGEWIQSVSVLEREEGILAAVDALRNGIHIVNLTRRTRRFLAVPPEWRLHSLVGMPPWLTTRSLQHLVVR